MPRKTKDPKVLENEEKIEKKSVSKRSTTKKEIENKKNKETKSTNSRKKATTKKSDSESKKEKKGKKEETPKTTRKRTSRKTSETEISKSQKVTSRKKVSTTPKTAITKKSNKKVEIVEYYDLPYRYNQTIVKVLAQTPTNLFIYWDISDSDRQNFEKQYGEHFFENTRPVLIVHNNTLHYSFEIKINDFANSWYLHVSDSKCDYKIELGRRPIFKTQTLNQDYIYVATSNEIESPNDRILFDQNQKMVYFRNVKNGKITGKSINSISFIKNMGKIYNIYDLYKVIYQNENLEDYLELTSNPSSGNPSSNSLSSKFK